MATKDIEEIRARTLQLILGIDGALTSAAIAEETVAELMKAPKKANRTASR
jgi:hypothetical protein